jgi:hypothetical protein
MPPRFRLLPQISVVSIALVCASCGHQNAGEVGVNEASTSASGRVVDPGERLNNDAPQTIAPPAGRATPDPRLDGWQTEAFTEATDQQLKALGHFLTDKAEIDATRMGELLTSSFFCTPLRPAAVKAVYQDQVVTVERGEVDGAGVNPERSGSHRGSAGLAAALQSLRAPLMGADGMRAKFKTFHVVPTNPSTTLTRHYVALSGRAAAGMIEQNATWSMRWKQESPEAIPKIDWIGVEDFEEVTTRNAKGPLFADLTESVLGGTRSYKDQLSYGNPYWRKRIESYLRFYQFGHNGIAIGDVNGDGLDDIYVCQTGGLPNRLYVQQIDGTAHDLSAAAGVDFLDSSQSALLVDLDNDGDQDLIVAMVGDIVLLENDGTGRFSRRATLPRVANAFSLAAADYDQDGDLDFYACVYYAVGEEVGEFPVPMPYFDANNGGRNRLFRNEGGWRFDDVTVETGLDRNNRRFSFAAVWEDFDDDGDFDLYVANDFGLNNLFRNDSGQFVDVAATSGMEQGAFGMSAAVGDYDRDGRYDVYLAAMFSGAGSRITLQPQFKGGGLSDDVRARFRYMARGNTLFRGVGNGRFEDVSEAACVTYGRWAWASLFFDLNNDGWEDLLVANGFVTGDVPDDL